MDTGCTGIDHIGIVSDNLSELEAWCASMGFRVAPRCELVAIMEDGSERPLNQHNSHLVFGRTYVELTAVTGELKGHHLEQALGRYFGFHIIAMLAEDAGREHQRLEKIGTRTDQVAVAGRSIDYPSGRGMGRFRWFRVPDKDAPEAFFCYVEHVTPDLVFDPQLNNHPNGAHELHEVVICTQTPKESAQRLAKICNSQVSQTDTGFVIDMCQASIRLVGPERGQHEYGETPMPALPFAVGFNVLTRDLQGAERCLETQGTVRRERQALYANPTRPGLPVIGFVEG